MLADKWIEIDISAVKNNLQEIKQHLNDRARLIAVIKANAYGHGAEDIARLLMQNGVDFFAVSFLHEALQLRKAGISADILVFSPIISKEEVLEAVKNKLTLTITSDNDREMLEQVGGSLTTHIKVHLKIDTGLGRFGMNQEEAVSVCRDINRNELLFPEGIYTHIADPGTPAFINQQFQQFMLVVNRLEQENFIIPVKHFANSSVFLSYPGMYLNAVRIGTLLSGQHPAGKFPVHLQLQDPYKFKSRIISVRVKERGSFLGYYRTHRLKHTAQIAVIPVGFNDGLAVEIANRPVGLWDMCKKMVKIILNYLNISRFSLNVTIKGKPYPIRGKVFMQMALVEIPLGVDVMVGDEVELPVRKTLVSRNIDRLYVQYGQAGKVANDGGTRYIVDND
ncbi:MAG: alanine racemase [Syntrophomonas sp.]|nr:alanine racemase [Syntrophomonas sp.]